MDDCSWLLCGGTKPRSIIMNWLICASMLTVRETECSNVVWISLTNSLVCFVLSKVELLGISSILVTQRNNFSDDTYCCFVLVWMIWMLSMINYMIISKRLVQEEFFLPCGSSERLLVSFIDVSLEKCWNWATLSCACDHRLVGWASFDFSDSSLLVRKCIIKNLVLSVLSIHE